VRAYAGEAPNPPWSHHRASTMEPNTKIINTPKIATFFPIENKNKLDASASAPGLYF
jgi:hypothetical protein